MQGAPALLRTLVASGVDVCFTNPGTSEMHFVAALDEVPDFRAVLALFEGVATGAADGYGRMADRPAATLLHLGPGLGNGFANLHNARRARTPVVNIVGDHATYHRHFDAPLTSDIASIAHGLDGWVRTSESPAAVGPDAAAAVAAAFGPPGQVATLILPADVCWLDGAEVAPPVAPAGRLPVADATLASVAKVLRSGEPAAILAGGSTLRRNGITALRKLAQATGAKLLAETFPARLERGAGVPQIDRLGYLPEFVEIQLSGVKHLIVVDTTAPVSFFAYPGKPSELHPEGSEVHVLARPGEDALGALRALIDEFDAGGVEVPLAPSQRPALPSGPLTVETAAMVIGALLPEGAIVSEEANTSSLPLTPFTAGAPAHDWLTLTGGSIGQGMPVATGAAVASPDRPVVCLESDGSAMYTLQSLWTQAREGLDVTTVIFNNGAYAILNLELVRVGVTAGGDRAKQLFNISTPPLDFVAMSRGMGVPAERVDSAEGLAAALGRAFAEPGPHLIDAVVPSIVPI